MRIALNLLYLIPGVVGGTETYARGLVRALALVDSRNEYLLFVSREAADVEFTEAPNFRRVVCPVRAVIRSARYGWEQTMLPLALWRSRVDLVHSLGYVGPCYTPCPHVLTIPDLNYIGHPAMSPGRRLVLRFFVETAARRAAAILTISNFSRREVEARFGLPDGAVTVTHLAGRATLVGPDAAREAADRYQVARPYIAAFSSTFRHKNIPRLLAAFRAVAPAVPHTLVLMGQPHPDMQATLDEMPELGQRVVWTGFVPDADVWPLLSGAELLVIPSMYEGFGLPVLDAQQLGVPVASSNAGSLPEVGGDGAIYFDPQSVPDMAAVIGRCLDDEVLRRSLVQRGTRNAARFSWNNTALTTCSVYERYRPNRRARITLRHQIEL